MRILLVFFLTFISSMVMAQGSAAPRGWAEMQTPDPIILSWIKVMEVKSIEDAPTIMIQKHNLSLQWEKSLDQITSTEEGCKKVSAKDSKDWNQLYCLINRNVIAILWRGESEDMTSTLKAAKNWLYDNE